MITPPISPLSQHSWTPDQLGYPFWLDPAGCLPDFSPNGNVVPDKRRCDVPIGCHAFRHQSARLVAARNGRYVRTASYYYWRGAPLSLHWNTFGCALAFHPLHSGELAFWSLMARFQRQPYRHVYQPPRLDWLDAACNFWSVARSVQVGSWTQLS